LRAATAFNGCFHLQPEMEPYPVEHRNGIEITAFSQKIYIGIGRAANARLPKALWHMCMHGIFMQATFFTAILEESKPDVLHSHLIDVVGYFVGGGSGA